MTIAEKDKYPLYVEELGDFGHCVRTGNSVAKSLNRNVVVPFNGSIIHIKSGGVSVDDLDTFITEKWKEHMNGRF